MSLLRRQRKMCCRKCQRCCVRLREVVFNPEYWYSYASAGLSMWVKQSVVVFWGISESLICAILLTVEMLHSKILEQGWLSGWIDRVLGDSGFKKTVSMHLVCRALCGILCVFAAAFRKVGRMKGYFSLMLVNILLTAVLLSPITMAHCECEDMAMGTPQCVMVKNFAGLSSGSVVLPSSAPDFARSLGLARRMEDGEVDDGDDDEVKKDTGDGGDQGHSDHGDPKGGDDSSVTHGLDDKMLALLKKFKVLPYGIQYEVDEKELCSSSQPGAEVSGEIRQVLYEAQCRGNRWKEMLVTKNKKDLAFVDTLKAMKACSEEIGCRVVRVQHTTWKELQDTEGADFKTKEDAQRDNKSFIVRSCRIRDTLPNLGSKEDPTCKCNERCANTVFLGGVTETCPASCTNTYVYLGLLGSQSAVYPEFLCTVTVGGFLAFTLLLTIWSLAMVCIIYTFMRNRCGDAFVTEDQWEVRDSTSFATTNTQMWDEDDDFSPVDVSRLPSGSQAWERGSVDSARGSRASVELEMTERPR